MRFSSKIKRKNQERLSVIYTELATIPKFHRTAGVNQARRKRRSLQAGRYIASQLADIKQSNRLFQKKIKQGGERGRGYVWNFQGYQRNSKRNLKG